MEKKGVALLLPLFADINMYANDYCLYHAESVNWHMLNYFYYICYYSSLHIDAWGLVLHSFKLKKIVSFQSSNITSSRGYQATSTYIKSPCFVGFCCFSAFSKTRLLVHIYFCPYLNNHIRPIYFIHRQRTNIPVIITMLLLSNVQQHRRTFFSLIASQRLYWQQKNRHVLLYFKKNFMFETFIINQWEIWASRIRCHLYLAPPKLSSTLAVSLVGVLLSLFSSKSRSTIRHTAAMRPLHTSPTLH